MSLPEYKRTHETETSRVRWVYDEDYQSEGTFALDTEEETQAVVEEELKGLRAGNLVALGAIVETRCAACKEWRTIDSLWGIVVSVDEDLTKLGSDMLDIPGVKS